MFFVFIGLGIGTVFWHAMNAAHKFVLAMAQKSGTALTSRQTFAVVGFRSLLPEQAQSVQATEHATALIPLNSAKQCAIKQNSFLTADHGLSIN